MQSDTFLNDTDSEDDDISSDSSGELPKNNNIGVFFQHFRRFAAENFHSVFNPGQGFPFFFQISNEIVQKKS